MRSSSANDVAEIFSAIETDNAFIIGDMIHAALAMPASIAKRLVPSIAQAAIKETLWIFFKDASDLCVHLAKGDQVESAIELVAAQFNPIFERGKEEPKRHDVYWYKDGLKKIVPIFAEFKPNIFLPMLCDWLKAAVEAKSIADSDNDYSYMWRPAIEDHSENRDYDFAGTMVGFLRQALELAVSGGHSSLQEALKIIEKYPYLVFKRIRLHLINEFAESDTEQARKSMMDHALFESYQFKHEYARLVSSHVNLLTDEQRNVWFEWVDAGPDMSNYDELFERNSGRKATAQDRKQRIDYWKFEKLHWVRVHLQGHRKEFYDNMRSSFGEPRMVDLNVHSGTFHWGSESPMKLEEFAGMTFKQTIHKISEWKPKGSSILGEPSIEGLASTFAQYVANNVEEYSSEAQSLIQQPAIFVRVFIEKMSEAAKNGRKIDIHAVIDLCRWVIGRPVEERTTPAQEHEGLLTDASWQWTRDEIARFLENVCSARDGDVPIYSLDSRELIWDVIDSICRDSSKSSIVPDISADDPRTHDYLNLGINSPSGKALEAGLEYARWVAAHISERDGAQAIVPGGFNSMTEVRQMIEWHIAPENKNVGTMAVIGSRINLLYWIDKQWLAENAKRLFQLENTVQESHSAQGWAAWNAFLVWVRPYIGFYDVFKEQFVFAVNQAGKVEIPEGSREQPMFHLAEHLIALYGYGQISLDSDGGLLKRFLADSNSDIRRHAIGFVGQFLSGSEKAPGEIVERFMNLWDIYWEDVGKRDAIEKPGSYLFGTWVESGQFPGEWMLDRLDHFVEVVSISEPSFEIGKALSEMMNLDLVKSVRILGRMIRGDTEGWRIYGWNESIQHILERAMKTPGEHRDLAVELINYLGRRGYLEFGELLRQKPI